MNDIEGNLSRTLAGYREQLADEPPTAESWDQIAQRAVRTPRRMHVVLIAVGTAFLVLTVALISLLPDGDRPPTSDRVTTTDGELFYMSLKYDGNVFRSSRIISLDLRSGRKRTVAKGGPCGDSIGRDVDPSGRLFAACDGDAIRVIDLATGRSTRIRRQNGFAPAGWSQQGNLLLLQHNPVSRLFELKDGSMKRIYAPDREIYHVVPLASGTFAVLQSATSSCERGCTGGLALVRGGRVLQTIQDAVPLTSFDDGRALLFDDQVRGSTHLAILRERGGRFVRDEARIRGSFSEAVVGPDGRIALTGSRTAGGEAGVFVFDPESSRLVRIIKGLGPIAWTPDGSLVHSAENLHSIRLTTLEGRSRVLVRGGDVRALTVTAASSTSRTKAEAATFAPFDDCPPESPLPTGPDARSEAIAAVKRSVPDVYENPKVPEALDTTGYEITRSYAADPEVGFGSIAYSQCGNLVGDRTWVIELRFPRQEPSASLSQGQVFVSRFRDGWRVWYRYH